MPVVLYHGAKPWSAPRSLRALVDVPAGLEEGLAPYVPAFDYLVDDLSATSDAALRARAMMTALAKLVLVCFKHMRTEQPPVAVLSAWADVLNEAARAPSGLEALELVLRYIMLVSGQVEIETLQSFLEREVGPHAKETVMTLAQRLIEQGVEQGLEQGLEQGVERGKLEGERAILLRQLQQRFGGELDPQTERRVATATADQVEAWALHILAAETLDDVFKSYSYGP